MLAALDHKEPDRVPLCLGASGASVTDAVYFALKTHFGIEGDVEPFRSGHGDNIYDPRVFDKMGCDFRHVFLKSSLAYKAPVLPDGSTVNEWGVAVKKVGIFNEWVSHPLQHASLADLDSYPWPKPYEGQRDRGLKQTTLDYYENTGFAIATRSPSRGLFDLAIQLRGFSEFALDLYTNRRFASVLLGKINEVLMAFYDVLLDDTGPYVHIVETQDDMGHQNGPFFSPKTFREFFKPLRRELNAFIGRKAPNARIYLHSCGAVSEFIDDLIDCGIQVLNPVQPLARGMDTTTLKQRYGAALTFHGAIDLQRALAGTPEDVEREVKTRVRDLAPGGGYILSPANVVQADVPVSNLILLFDLARRYGAYPISVG